MQLYSQRDQRWGYKQLGTHPTSTIYSHGCTITCLAMMADIRPDEVNARMKAVDGYALGNLVNWWKIQEAIPWLKFEKRVRNDYNNLEVSKNLPTLVEVDGSRIGSDKHWVLYIGNQKMYDPWYGTEKSTNYYAPIGYAIINRVGNPPGGGEPNHGDPMIYKGLDLNNQESMKVAVDTWYAVTQENKFVSQEKVDELKEIHAEEKKTLQALALKKQQQYERLVGRLADTLGTSGDIAEIEVAIDKLVTVGDQLTKCVDEKADVHKKLIAKINELDGILAELSQLTGSTVKTKEGISKALATYLKNNGKNPDLLEYDWWERLKSLFGRR